MSKKFFFLISFLLFPIMVFAKDEFVLECDKGNYYIDNSLFAEFQSIKMHLMMKSILIMNLMMELNLLMLEVITKKFGR